MRKLVQGSTWTPSRDLGDRSSIVKVLPRKIDLIIAVIFAEKVFPEFSLNEIPFPYISKTFHSNIRL